MTDHVQSTHETFVELSTADRKRFGDRCNAFAFSLFAQLRSQRGNLLFSPYSVRAALGMLLAGARGETAAELRRVLCATDSEVSEHIALVDAERRLLKWQARYGPSAYEFHPANSVWRDAGVRLERDFLELVERYYAGCVREAPFSRDPVGARLTVNAWVEDRTRQRIRELITPGFITELTRLVLVNALHLKAAWEQPFDVELTEPGPFWRSDGTEVQAPFMAGHVECAYVETSNVQVLELGLKGGMLSLLVLLPRQRAGLAEFEQSLTGGSLAALRSQMRQSQGDVFLPRFRFEWGTVRLGEPLQRMGLELAFDWPRADLSGLNGRLPPDPEAISVSEVVHKAFIQLDEDGLEAAAATAVQAVAMGAPIQSPPEREVFRADHPFLFAILDDRPGTVLFLGRVEDPTRG